MSTQTTGNVSTHLGLGLTASALALVYSVRSTAHRWGMASTAACEFGAQEQTADHVLHFLSSKQEACLEAVDEETVVWLNNTFFNILRVFWKETSTPYEEEKGEALYEF